MAIDINEFRLPMNVQEAQSYLQQETNSFGAFFNVDRCYELAGIMQRENYHLSLKAREVAKSSTLTLGDKGSVLKWLTGTKKVARKDLTPEGGKDLALNQATRAAVLGNPLYDEDVYEIVRLQSKYSSNDKNRGYLMGLAMLPNSVALDKYNHRMSRGCSVWEILSTSRLSARDPGIQGIPRNTPEILTEPKGYTLQRCDSGQIEPIINFSHFVRDDLILSLIIEYDDAYYGLLHYCTVSDAELDLMKQDFRRYFVKKQITDELADKRQTLKTLTNAGSYGSQNLGNIDPVLAKAYDTRIVKHPKRLALERTVIQQIENGVDTFYSAFGTPITPESTQKYTKGGKGWEGHLKRCGINNPVQATASDLMMFSINKAREILSRAKDTHICYYKHDEACFYISDEDMANGIGEELKDVTAYNVKGWAPIHAKAEIGVKYGNVYPSYL